MAGGYEKNQDRKAALASLGKGLARRSGSKCELCSASKVSLFTVEVPPEIPVPDIDTCVFICETCRNGLSNLKSIEADHWRCLNDSAWSDVPAVKVTAVRILRRLTEDHRWAADILEDLYLEPEEEEWANKA